MKKGFTKTYVMAVGLFFIILFVANAQGQDVKAKRSPNSPPIIQKNIPLISSSENTNPMEYSSKKDEKAEEVEDAILSHDDFMNTLDLRSEMIELRDKNSRHFQNPDGTITAVVASGSSMNYWTDNQWIPIETKIAENKENEPNKRFVNAENQFTTYYSEKAGTGNQIDFKEGTLHTWINPSIGYINEKGERFKIATASSVKGMTVSSSIYYRNIYSNTDARFTQGTDGNKLDYIIQSEKFLEIIPKEAQYVVFYEEFQIPKNWTVSPILSINRYKEEIISNILFSTNEKLDILKLNRPFYHEQNPATKKDMAMAEGSYDFIMDGEKIKIGIKVPVDWLKSEYRTFPVIIDPTNDCYPNNTYWWTGHTEKEDGSSSIYSTNDDIMAGWYDYTWPTANGRINGWAKYNISSIPTTAVILNTTIKLTAYDIFGETTIYFGKYGNNSYDPVSRSGEQNYSDVADATTYASRYFSSTGSVSISGNSTMNSNIQTKLSSGWFAMGIYAANTGDGGSLSNDSYYVNFRGYSASGTSRPYLTVQYCAYQPTANAGTNKTLCNQSSATMNANSLLTGETGAWTIVSGGSGCSFSSTTSPTAVVSNIPQGTSVLRWTVRLTDGGCSSSSTVTITNNTPTTPNAGSDVITCNSSYQLSGNNPTFGTGTWSVISGSGVFSPNNNTYNATVSDLNNGNNTLRWTISKNGCSLTDDVIITLNSLPAVSITTPASTPYDLCADNFSGLTGNNPNPATGQWSVVSGTGTFSAPTNNITNITGLSPGDNIIRWTVTASGLGCVNQANVTLRNNLPTTANAGPNQLISGSSTTLTGNNPVQGIGQWSLVSAVPADGNGIIWSPSGPPAGQNIVTVSDLETDIMYTFKWTISHGSCPVSFSTSTVFWDPGTVGLIVQSNLTNEGHFNQTNDTSYFYMTGTNKFIYGTDADNRYTNTKLKIRGSITFDGVINNGKFAKTYITPACTFNVNSSKTYKNHYFYNAGTSTLSTTSTWENSGTWYNAHIVNAHPTSTVTYNGSTNQTVTSKWDGTNNAFGNVIILNTSTPNASTGVMLETHDMVLKNTSSLTLTNGSLITNGKMIIVNNPAYTGIVLGSGNTTGTESWVYGTSNTSTLRKFMNDDAQTYHFPVGAAIHGNLATIINHNLPNGQFSLDVWFKENPANVNDGFPSNITEQSTRYSSVAPEGVWVFNQNGIMDGTYDLKLYYNQFTTTSWTDEYHSILSRPTDLNNGTNWELPPTNSLFQAMSVSSGNAYRTGLNTFSEKGIGLLINTLPVELLEFYLYCMDDFPMIYWSTATEINNSHYVLEKSHDAQIFIPIARIEGAGNSNSLLNYSYQDTTYHKTSYYRLKQIDFDGSTTVYDPIVANCHQQISYLKVYPNPFKEYVVISSDKQSELLIKITDGSGKLILQERINFDGNYYLDLKDLSRGVYVLILQFENEEQKPFKMIKN